MNIKFHITNQLNNELIQRYFKAYNNKCLDEISKDSSDDLDGAIEWE